MPQEVERNDVGNDVKETVQLEKLKNNYRKGD